MDDHRFDDCRRSVSTRVPRRTWVAGLASGLLTLLSPALGGEPLQAKKRKRKKKKEKTYRFLANPMTGSQEVSPTIGDPLGLGSANFTVEGKTICGVFTLSAATSFTVTGTHIHEGAAGVNGPIVVDFGVATLGAKVCVNCSSSACAAGVLSRIKANPAGFYANIHTNTNQLGAVRGQLQRV
jgi:hypothetical protein